jgi:phage terminase large subunit-like protein
MVRRHRPPSGGPRRGAVSCHHRFMLDTSPLDLLARGRALLDRREELASRWACDLEHCDGLPHTGWLHHHARHTQREPADYETWLIKTGRGWGKTRTGAETVKGWGTQAKRHIAVIAKTDREARNICFEGPAGLLSVIRPNLIPRTGYTRSVGDTKLTLTNGTTYRAFSAESPDIIRGYAFDGAWLDEYAAWSKETAQDVWDNLWFALREAAEPHVVVTTTPRNLPHVKAVLAEASVITQGHMLDNVANLSDKALTTIYRKYEGTRLGRQELEGELLEDVEGALWTFAMIDADRISLTDYETDRLADTIWRIVVAVDPAGTNRPTSDETGLVVVGVAGNPQAPHLYVLDDKSGRYSPDGWAAMAVDLHDKWGANAIVAEVNNGWDMVANTLKHQDARPRVIQVKAKRAKHLRAEPIVALYEQHRVHHVGGFGDLEDQMTTWTPASTDDSPDRLDALVYACTELTRILAAEASFGGSLMAGVSLTPRRA